MVKFFSSGEYNMPVMSSVEFRSSLNKVQFLWVPMNLSPLRILKYSCGAVYSESLNPIMESGDEKAR